MFSGTWVNDVRLQPGILWELSDGDTLTFGDPSAPGSPVSYFLFQKVKVRPLDFDAITIPKVRRSPVRQNLRLTARRFTLYLTVFNNNNNNFI